MLLIFSGVKREEEVTTIEIVTAKQYVELLLEKIQAQRPMYQWILEHGTGFKPEPFTDEEERLIASVRKTCHLKRRGCFYNAQMLAINSDGKLEYYDGWAMTEHLKGIPIEHGFNAINGKVVDLTWKDGVTYFGVPIPVEFICKQQIKSRYAGSLMGDWLMANLRRG